MASVDISADTSHDTSADISVDHRPTISRLSVADISADSRPINVHISADASAVIRSIYRSIIGRLSVDYRSTIDISIYRSIVGLYVDRGHL